MVGYASDDNPSARIGDRYTSGHDFAIVENRWIVDYWGWRCLALLRLPILDMEDKHDRLIINMMYGPRKYWSTTWDPTIEAWPLSDP